MAGEVFAFETHAVSHAPAEAVYALLANVREHMEWAGRRAKKPKFRLVNIEAPEGPAQVGAEFRSVGADSAGTFNDSSRVTEASAPRTFAFETDSRLERKKGAVLEMHNRHRYDLRPEGDATRIDYSFAVERASYLPYWLKPWMRPLTKSVAGGYVRKNLENLARLAEERGIS
jgi:hypothetical protein